MLIIIFRYFECFRNFLVELNTKSDSVLFCMISFPNPKAIVLSIKTYSKITHSWNGFF